jgi:hypothetical protein
MDYELICRFVKNIPGFSEKGFYLSDKPMVYMSACGASWKNEIKSINESKRALIQNDLWNAEGRKSYLVRISRIRFKQFLSVLGLNFIVKIWRKNKWKN